MREEGGGRREREERDGGGGRREEQAGGKRGEKGAREERTLKLSLEAASVGLTGTLEEGGGRKE
jgi:hypothetical protein